jgi:hypothetical protein
MQKTMQKGKAVLKAKEFCDTFRRSDTSGPDQKKRKVAFPRTVWEEVMTAGFAQYPVGKLLDAGTNNSRVQFSEPPGPSASRGEKVRYHNQLVDLCQMTCRGFTKLLAESAEGFVDADGAAASRDGNGERADNTADGAEGPAAGNGDVGDVGQAAASTSQQADRDAALG